MNSEINFQNICRTVKSQLNYNRDYNKMSNNNQPNRNYNHPPNPNYQPRRSYTPNQPNNQLPQSNERPPIHNQYYNPNQRAPYGNPADMQRHYPGNYYYPYPYNNYSAYPPQQFAPPPMYMQQHMYTQQMHPNVHQQLEYNRQMLQYQHKQNQYSPNSATQIKKSDEVNQGTTYNGAQISPKKQSPHSAKKDSQYSKTFEKQSNSNRTPEKKQSNYNEDQDRQLQINQYESDSDSEDEQEQIYYKKKAIIKKKDPVLDNREQIRKWVEARRRNYPRKNITQEQKQNKCDQDELSLLEKKIRKKICLINSDPKSILKKQKDLDILRRFILYPRRPRKEPKYLYERKQNDPLVQEIVEKASEKQIEPELQMPLQKVVPEEEEIIQKLAEIKEEEEHVLQEPLQVPIKSNASIVEVEKEHKTYEGGRNKREDLSVDVIIKHLQMKQREDTKVLSNLMDYKTNSFNYRYQHQTLETNLLLQNIFKDTSYMLQAIRYIVKNNFFD